MRAPHIVAWETTRACNLACVHCRASAMPEPPPGELTTSQGTALLDDLAASGVRLVILSGGEALVRGDILELAAHGTRLGLRMTLATNGTLVTADVARALRDAGVVRVSVSLDGVTRATHDGFRGVDGSFDAALAGIARLNEAGVAVQVNTTVAAANIGEMDRFPGFLETLGACAWHVFFLVPTGRGAAVEPARANGYRMMLEGFRKVAASSRIECKATCAPQYYRMLLEDTGAVPTKGCLAGTGFGFVSSTGVVQPCGFLQVACGDVRETPFSRIWATSPFLENLRDTSRLTGKCGSCGHADVCGGCRARAYEVFGDSMAADPICWFEEP